MPQNPPSAPLRQRLSDRYDDLQYQAGVRLRDALRTAQSHAWKTTWFFWLGALMTLIGLLIGIAAKGMPSGWGRYLLDGLGTVYVLVALGLFAMHIEIKHRERKWRHQPHGGDEHPAQ